MRRPRSRRLLLVSAAVPALLVGCSGGSTGGSPHRLPPISEGPRVDLGAVHLTAAQLDALAAADNAFAGELYHAVAADQSGNVVMSPASVAIALQMAYAGARGQTATEMAKALHVTGTSPLDVAAAAARFLRELAPLAADKNELLNIVNKVWVQSGFPLVSGFDTAMRSGFGAGMQRTDFEHRPDAARQAINAAIAAATHDKIKDLLAPGIINDTIRLVLTNAVYLHAGWASPFEAGQTLPRAFHLADGRTTMPSTMKQTASLGYVRGNGYRAVELPYAGGRLAMTILLPDGALAPLEARFAETGLSALVGAAKPTRLTLELPKFRFTGSTDMKAPLQSLGMRTPFTPAADFTGISTAEPLSIAFVAHQAFVAVDEKGTEAAAATAVGIGVTGVRVETPQQTVVRVDHPFLFAITDTTTGLPLFVGRVADPARG